MKKIKLDSLKVHFNFKDKTFKKRFIVRISTIIIIILIGVWMFFIGKQHTLNLANVQTTINGVQYKGVDGISVKFDKRDEFTSYADFSDEIIAIGQKHTLTINDGNNEYKKRFRIPISYRNVIINIPAFINNPDNVSSWMTEIKTSQTTSGNVDVNIDDTDTSEFGM